MNTQATPVVARAPKAGFIELITANPVVFAVALAAGALIAIGGLLFFKSLSDSEEAPIRVKNGSMDFTILSQAQEWEQVGTSGNWKVANGIRYTDNFEVTVAVRSGASCAPSLTATGSDIVVTYDNNNEIRLQSQNKHTFVKPGTGVTMTLVSAQLLSYQPAGTGYIKQIAVGNGGNPAALCTFTAANQLDHLLVLNVP